MKEIKQNVENCPVEFNFTINGIAKDICFVIDCMRDYYPHKKDVLEKILLEISDTYFAQFFNFSEEQLDKLEYNVKFILDYFDMIRDTKISMPDKMFFCKQMVYRFKHKEW
jgi:hypothetical protein